MPLIIYKIWIFFKCVILVYIKAAQYLVLFEKHSPFIVCNTYWNVGW